VSDPFGSADEAIRLQGVSKSFGSVVAVSDVSLTIKEGEFFSMLGPSGSGKTTVLRLIAGFEKPDLGQIELFGQAVDHLPPFIRPVNTVFQDYALFPHMTVGENVGYGLRVKGVSRNERSRQVEEVLNLVRLSGFESRKPSELSGGQKQRVALARSLVLKPKALLLDEPLGALDQKLREEMQIELRQIQREVGITFVLVTHDQVEALSLSDRIAVFSAGNIEQIGSPEEIYQEPASQFVAQFVGTCNLFEPAESHAFFGTRDLTVLRPENIQIAIDGEIEAQVVEVAFQGAQNRYLVATVQGKELVVTVPSEPGRVQHQKGQSIRLRVDKEKLTRLNH
jgi:putative spermidine/putrescine transport system ATP-binding protein